MEETAQTQPAQTEAPATAQETAQETQTDTSENSPGITDELQRTIVFLESIKDKQEEFKKKPNNDPEKEKLEADLIKIMTDFNQTIEDLFIILKLDNDKLSHARSPSPSTTAKGLGEQAEEGAQAEAGPEAGAPAKAGPEAGAPTEARGPAEAQPPAEAMGGNKSKTQKKQSKNKNKNKTQKKKH